MSTGAAARAPLDRFVVTDQRDVDRELAVAVDEFLGAVERIDQPEIVPPVPDVRCVLSRRLFREHGNVRGELVQPRAQDVVRGVEGGADEYFSKPLDLDLLTVRGGDVVPARERPIHPPVHRRDAA